MSVKLENYIPVVMSQGLNTNKNAVFGGNVTVTGTLTAGSEIQGAEVITSATANAFSVGPNGTTNPTFNVDSSTTSAATGLNVKAAAAGSGVSITAVSSGTNEPLVIDAKGSGGIGIGTNSTGTVALARGANKTIITSTALTSIGTQNGTLTAAQMLGGTVEHVSTTGAGTLTVATGLAITGAINNPAVGDTFTTVYANTGSQTVTVTTNTGITLVGTVTVATGKIALLTTRLLGSNTCTIYVTVSA